MSCPGNAVEDSTNASCINPLKALEIKKYYNDKEFRLYTCINYPSKCK
jgi:hypothetical protein